MSGPIPWLEKDPDQIYLVRNETTGKLEPIRLRAYASIHDESNRCRSCGGLVVMLAPESYLEAKMMGKIQQQCCCMDGEAGGEA